MDKKEVKGYWSPYVAGFGLGLTLLAVFVLMGRGLGASTGLNILTACGLSSVVPSYIGGLKYFANVCEIPSVSGDLNVIMLIGVLGGSFAGASVGEGFKLRLDKGLSIGSGARFAAAIGGGVLIGFATRLARGCSSGLALSGSAFLTVSGWVFLIGMFIGGFIAAGIFRRLWS